MTSYERGTVAVTGTVRTPAACGSTSRAATCPEARDSTVTSSRQPVESGCSRRPEQVSALSSYAGPPRSSVRPSRTARRAGRTVTEAVSARAKSMRPKSSSAGSATGTGEVGVGAGLGVGLGAGGAVVVRTIRGPPSPHPATAAATSTATTARPARITAASCHAAGPAAG